MNNVKLLRQRASLYLNLLKAQKIGQVRPVVCDLFITTRCNAKCNYCYTDASIPENAEYSTAHWKVVIDDLYDMGCRMINLMGGEPLLRKDFKEILEYIMSKNIVCDVNSNCFLVPEYIETLKKCSQIFTSLDGDEEAHDRNRGKGTFKKTVAGIVAARKAGIPVRVNCTVTKHNAGKVDFLIDLADQYNLFLTFTPLIRIRDKVQERAQDLNMDDQESRWAFRRIKEAKRRTSRIMNSDESLDFFINYPVEIGRIVQRDESGSHTEYYPKPCAYGHQQFFIVSNGDVFTCHNMWNEPSFVPKNVFKDGLAVAVRHAHGQLTCKFCWLANLVEWNQFTSPSWLAKGLLMTFRQMLSHKEL